MSREKISPEEAMAALLDGLALREQVELLGRLEMAGAKTYRALEVAQRNSKAREALLRVVEEKNGDLLRRMITEKNKSDK